MRHSSAFPQNPPPKKKETDNSDQRTIVSRVSLAQDKTIARTQDISGFTRKMPNQLASENEEDGS